MCNERGAPHLMFTFNPDAANSFRVLDYCKEPKDQLSDFSSLLNNLFPSLSERKAIVGTNPYACAKYFHNLVNIVIQYIFGWNISKHCSNSTPGFFGYTKAFFGSTESQNSLNLHIHFLVWIEGMPMTLKEFKSKCDEVGSNFKSKLLGYVTSRVTNSLPIDSITVCPRCYSDNLVKKELTKSAFKKPVDRNKPPIVAVCGNCSFELDCNSFLDLSIESHANDETLSYLSESAIEFAICDGKPLPKIGHRNDIQSLQLAKTLLQYQQHSWQHTRSCFKPTPRTPRGNICRFLKPEELVEESKFVDDYQFVLQRDMGHNFLNTFSVLLAQLFRCNHDIKFLRGTQGFNYVYYALKYSTKAQQLFENYVLLHLNALKKSESAENRRSASNEDGTRENDGSSNLNDSAVRGRRRIMRMVNELTAPLEIGAPMANLYLINHSPFYWSHDFVNLYFNQTLNLLLNSSSIPITAIATSSEENHENQSISCINPQYIDYIYRPDELEPLSYFEFVKSYVKKKETTGLLFHTDHVQSDSHSLFKLKGVLPIVHIFGSRLPNINGDVLSNDQQLLFYQMMLILFKPFRNISHLVTDSTLENWKMSYDSWIIPDFAKRFLDNNLDYYECRRSSNDDVDRAKEYYNSLSGDDFGNDIDEHNFEDFEQDNVEHIHEDDDSNDLSDDFLNDAEDSDDEYLNQIFEQSNRNTLLGDSNALASAIKFFNNNVSHTFRQDLFPDYKSILNNRTYASIIESQLEDPDSALTFNNISKNYAFSKEIIVRQLRLHDTYIWTESNSSLLIQPNTRCPSLSSISKHFNLNFKQHKMFIAVGLKFFESIASDLSVDFVAPSHTNLFVQGQLIAFLAGGAGYGKSEVLKALLFLAKSWGFEGSILTTAHTGIAAVNVWGQTLYSLFKWSLKIKERRKKPTMKMKAIFSGVTLIIIDEVSMLSQHLLGRVDQTLKLLKGNSQVLGGVHLLMVGDWLQQAPIRSPPLFQEPDVFANEDTNIIRLREIGFAVYKSVNCVVNLKQNMRHSINSTSSSWFPSLLERLRFGEITTADMDKLNEVCYYSNVSNSAGQSISNESYDRFCPFIVTSHALRVQLNAVLMKSWAASTSTPLFEFKAQVRLPSGFNLSRNERNSLMNLWSNKTGNLSMILRLGLGMPMMCTVNLAPHLKLCNGSIGHVVHIQHHESNQISIFSDGQLFISRCTQIPEYILLKLWKIDQEFFPGLGPGVVPVNPFTNNSVYVELPDRNFNLNVTQIPLIPAFSLIVEKVQGLTMDSLVLGPLRNSSRRNPQRTAMHVANTRIRDAVNMRYMEPLTQEDIHYFKPSTALIEETRWLENLELQDK
jgi:hypothetical protein